MITKEAKASFLVGKQECVMKESPAGSKKRPVSLFYGDLWYNEAINIEIGRKTCFVLRKKKKSRYL